jgi:ribonuclease BN (tRNA processing enzyme)
VTSSLTVLGSCGAWPEPGRACSGYVVEHEGYRIVLDLGYGTISRLLAHLGSTCGRGLDAVLISHAHPDHMVDLHGLFRARWYGDPGASPIPLIAPIAVFNYLESLESPDEWKLADVFAWQPPTVDQVISLGPFGVTAHSLPHYVENVGFRLRTSRFTVAYTGDTGPCEELTTLSSNADLLVADSTDRHQAGNGAQDNLLLTAREAGRVAHTASVKKLMLTHFWPGNDRGLAAQDASSQYAGEVLVAEEGLRVDL